MGRSFIDQTGRKLFLTPPPNRIVSLVPSQTELLHYLGLDDRVVGITKFCIHPASWHEKKTKVGGTKNARAQSILSLKPDLVIANKEENTVELIQTLAENVAVWVSDVRNLEGALEMIVSIGDLTGSMHRAQELVKTIRHNMSLAEIPRPILKCAYLIWQNPIMTVSADTFIHEMLHLSGFENVFAHRKDSRYPAISMDDLINAGIQVLLLSSEPFPFNDQHIKDYKLKLPGVKVIRADGEMFSWYGSRLRDFDPRRYRAEV